MTRLRTIVHRSRRRPSATRRVEPYLPGRWLGDLKHEEPEKPTAQEKKPAPLVSQGARSEKPPRSVRDPSRWLRPHLS